MIVETYELPEIAEQAPEDAAECAKMAESLGLSGQKQYLAAPDAPACPYRLVTAEEAFVYGELCPKSVRIERYADGPIPLRIMQVIAHAKTLPVFAFLEVWCPATAAEKDPVLIGRSDAHDWHRAPNSSYLLARWGDELETFAVLMERAKQRAAARLRLAWEKIASTARERLASIETCVDPSAGQVTLPEIVVR